MWHCRRASQRAAGGVRVFVMVLVMMAVGRFGRAEGAESFFNVSSITIRDNATADPYPSSITVLSLQGISLVTDINVTLYGISHTYLDDVDILLVGPAGQSVILASNVSGSGGGQSVSSQTWTFDDAATTYLPNTNTVTSGTYKPTDYDDQSDPGDVFPAPAPSGSYGTTLSVFNWANPNGLWNLYAVDDYSGDSGSIAGGWSLDVEGEVYDHYYANANAITIRDNTTAVPYPSSIDVAGVSGSLLGLTVGLVGFSHTYADDVDILLVGPEGQSVILASNVSGDGSGQSVSDLSWTFSDLAADYLPNTNTLASGVFKPTDYDDQFDPGDVFPWPAPSGSYGTALGVFDGTNPNGTWSLYVVDDYSGDSGYISGGWWLAFGTDVPGPATIPAPASVNLVMAALGSLTALRRRYRVGS